MMQESRLIAATLIYLDLKKRESTQLGQDRHEAWMELMDLEAAGITAAPEPTKDAPMMQIMPDGTIKPLIPERVEPTNEEWDQSSNKYYSERMSHIDYLKAVSREAYRLAAKRGE